MKRAYTALNDWTATYASEFCGTKIENCIKAGVCGCDCGKAIAKATGAAKEGE